MPRLSAIVSKMLPHDALGIVCLDQQGRPIVNASTADVPDMRPMTFMILPAVSDMRYDNTGSLR